ncbi:DUF4390 domain-containing protein [candidate division KSB1 bacterium]|nr:DUF4390 domain-containing protein [candidate division KSB1 bacterium]TDJ00899.1 MAG: DUF4390 domain-containing protein [Caldithrix sp.]
MRKFVTGSFILILISVTFPLLAFAQAGSEILVERITPGLSGDSLVVSADFKNLFSRKIVGTIQSGLPSIVEIQIKLFEGTKQIVRKPISRSIEFDVWEERYRVRSPDTTQVYFEFEQVKQAANRLMNVFLISKALLAATKNYTIQIRVGIIPISAHQANKVSYWLENPNQSEEAIASDNRSSGFSLNINKLVSFFVNKKKGSRFSSKWFSSRSFRLAELK